MNPLYSLETAGAEIGRLKAELERMRQRDERLRDAMEAIIRKLAIVSSHCELARTLADLADSGKAQR